MSDVYVVVTVDEGEGDLEHLQGIFTDPVRAAAAADEVRADYASANVPIKVAVQVWEANRLNGKRTER